VDDREQQLGQGNISFLVELSNQLTKAIANLSNIEKAVEGHDRDIDAVKDKMSQLGGEFQRLAGKVSSADNSQPDYQMLKTEVEILVRDAARQRGVIDGIRIQVWGGLLLAIGTIIVGIVFVSQKIPAKAEIQPLPVSRVGNLLNLLHDLPINSIDLAAKEFFVSQNNSGGASS
jgi:hypothetical protein